jgi:hypothetical protein
MFVTVKTNGDYEIVRAEPSLKSLQTAVGGYIEIVRSKNLPDKMVMVVNEEGRLKNLKYNAFGCYIYGTEKHGNPIVGDIVFCRLDMTEDGQDLFALTDYNERELSEIYREFCGVKI